jgi:hypothetical protein
VSRRKKKRAGGEAPPPPPSPIDRRTWTRKLIVRVLLWLLPVGVVWMLLTPSYNRFLEIGGQNLVRLCESPDVTRLDPKDEHYSLISRLDFPAARETVAQMRLTDFHFPVVLLCALFLAVPEVGWKERLSNLGFALVLMAVFHLVLVLFRVKFTYATQLGDWSLDSYGAFGRNFWGLGKHVLELPVKLALPFLLWAGFYLDRLLPEHDIS